jgi:hypothetical protein
MEVLMKRKRTRQPSLDINTWKFPPLRLEIGEETLAALKKGYNKTPEERAQIRADNARFFAEFEEIAQATRKPGMTERMHATAIAAEFARRRAAVDPDFVSQNDRKPVRRRRKDRR